MPRPHPTDRATRARRSPSRPTAPRLHQRPGPPRTGRHSAGAVGVLTSALVGGGLVAGHVALGDDTVHVEQLALRAFATSPTEPVAESVAPAPTVAGPDDGAARALADPPPPLDVDAVVGAATGALDDAVTARRAADEAASAAASQEESTPAADVGPGSCAAGSDGFGAVAASTAAAGEQLRCMFGIETVLGVAGRSNASDHPAGKALDFMADGASGERLATYARQNMDELGISYVIYRQRIDTGSGWETMEDRGGATANHEDHVHISFD
ncbi:MULTISPECIES: hypothetical protein [Pseudonocardia]|uniref:ARB-07466-like C-terminal domain-containing protein n=2 Tax=Pseudonocardia TaxID=1847 RepID=A0A1Y2N3S5_PSEAH|nr:MULTISPECIES: hypothetical protein [Pseudonocardia]OSY42125.1 hypothetical protein BG845_01621 [Pseudonocardia autotrophica]TDN75107.1 hypothetical protein C8E95_4250 [Pseudonocardia autotrophica]BBF99052.1 hypothetical protein Pdca_02620 [Pseudonocardia autotrophica]GEC23972.1 hypothetical protein PSA01_10010 [Pseudonocardia saturnea]